MDLLTAASGGFATVDVDPQLRQRALSYLEQWLTQAEFADYRPQLCWLIETQQWSLLVDSFYQILPFGTGGRRGAVGIGPNRMNLWTLGASVQGHCEYLRQRFPDTNPLRVVLAYDVRRFEDRRRLYNPQLPNPVLHLSSRDFCHYAAGVYAANGIHTYLLPPDSARYMATPELSFTIRYLQAHGGLNMTASHNPPDDNGSKFYNEAGAQPVPPDDQIMSECVEQVTTIRHMPFAEAVRQGLVHFLDETPHRAYITVCRKQSLVPPPRVHELRVVFTPLHGCGSFCAGEVLELQGFRPIPVHEQMTPDGQFPHVTQTPNPEVPAALDRAEATAKEHQADLVIATDPDADRLGGLASTRPEGGPPYHFLTGQEIAALLTHFKLHQLAQQDALPPSPIVITTIVTTGLITRIGEHFGAQVINDLLVGFKYHADVLAQLESTGRCGEVRGNLQDFLIATEESHGVLVTPEIRDKDSAGAALLLAEVALVQKRRHSTIPAYISELYRQFGYFRNELRNVALRGLEGKRQMQQMLEALRRTPPQRIADWTVVSWEDLLDEQGRLGPFKGETDRAARNFLIFHLQNASGWDAKICVRPSGTEPKAKMYFEVSTPPPPKISETEWLQWQQQANESLTKLAEAFLQRALATVGLTELTAP
jgi:phosphoglucomutase/phosphomannomutase